MLRRMTIIDSHGVTGDFELRVDKSMFLLTANNKKEIHINDFLNKLDTKRYYIQTDDDVIKEYFRGRITVCTSGVQMIQKGAFVQ